ncbi:hypothetical protein Gogos_020354 [Gossypium gossypioides]|uniref:Uncharacterized protein n=1 Tax=Gossypium gossypioides TaxID=34282 RepID=A0A7J9CXP2_GOSGO|nr:hypothetical protein [Gossypium gossypioides]
MLLKRHLKNRIGLKILNLLRTMMDQLQIFKNSSASPSLFLLMRLGPFLKDSMKELTLQKQSKP